jgi:putative phosphoesterase
MFNLDKRSPRQNNSDMKIGVFSDVHDNLRNLAQALDHFAQRGIHTLIFCGDFCSPIPAREIGSYDGDVHCVFGNGDGDRFAISSWAAINAPRMKLHGEHAELEIDGHRIAVTHYPFYGQALARTGDYRAVFSGHTHVRHQEHFGRCLWLNPGEILGFKGEASCAVYDTDAGLAEYLMLGS